MRQMSFCVRFTSFLKSMREHNRSSLGAVVLVGGWSAEQSGGIPWWVWVLLVLIVLAIIIWWLMRQDDTVQSEEHTHAAHDQEELKLKLHGAEARALNAQVVEGNTTPAETPMIEVETEPVKADLVDIIEKAPLPEAGLGAESAPDDLVIVEGIGPKISAVLQEAGIVRFSQLAELQPEQITAILKGAGVRLADPTTWPRQAQLAAQGKWDELKSLQDNLKGGRKV